MFPRVIELELTTASIFPRDVMKDVDESVCQY